MIDWIEAVLGEAGEETEDEERPALDGTAEVRRPAPPRRDGAEDETEPETGTEPETWTETQPGDRTDGTAAPAGGTDWAGARTDGTAWTPADAAEAGRTERTPEAAGPGRETGAGPDGGPETGTASPRTQARTELKPDRETAAGLAELYRGAAEGARAPAPALAPEGASRTAPEREAGGAPGLTVEELDRAVRRDSRRYDGGMSIF